MTTSYFFGFSSKNLTADLAAYLTSSVLFFDTLIFSNSFIVSEDNKKEFSSYKLSR